MSGLLDSVERELHPDAPTADREALRAFRSRLDRKRVTEARKPYERKIDRLVESRHICSLPRTDILARFCHRLLSRQLLP